MFTSHWSRNSAISGSSFGDLMFRRVSNHRIYPSRMTSTSFSKLTSYRPQLQRAAISLPFEVHRLKAVIETSLPPPPPPGCVLRIFGRGPRRTSTQHSCKLSPDSCQLSLHPFEECFVGVCTKAFSRNLILLSTCQTGLYGSPTNPVSLGMDGEAAQIVLTTWR